MSDRGWIPSDLTCPRWPSPVRVDWCGRTWAGVTDGHALLLTQQADVSRLSRLDVASMGDLPRHGVPVCIADLLAWADPGDKPPPRCGICGGTGKLECGTCSGTGMHTCECEREHDCGDCDGEGWYACRCSRGEPPPLVGQIGGIYIDRRLLHMFLRWAPEGGPMAMMHTSPDSGLWLVTWNWVLRVMLMQYPTGAPPADADIVVWPGGER